MKKFPRFLSKKTLKTFAKLCVFALVLLETKRFCKNATDGFSVANISKEISYDQGNAPLSFTEEEQALFNQITKQKFTYLAKGAQCYAFVSEDQNYVIKFFKKNTLTVPLILEPLPFNFVKEKKELKKEKIIQEFTSYEIAKEQLENETGLLFLHLKPTHFINQEITIIDRLNIEHKIDLDKIEFIIQKKGDLIYPVLNDLMKSEKTEEAKALISSIFSVLETRAAKGILDTDPNVSKNFACIENKVIEIDIGRFRKLRTNEVVGLFHLERMKEDFRKWISLNHPLLLSHFDEEYDLLVQKGSF